MLMPFYCSYRNKNEAQTFLMYTYNNNLPPIPWAHFSHLPTLMLMPFYCSYRNKNEAQTFLMYTYNNNLITDSSNKLNLTKNNTRESGDLPSFLTLPLTAIRSFPRIHVPLDMFPTLAVNPLTCPPLLCKVGP
jgi:hypothetical protein